MAETFLRSVIDKLVQLLGEEANLLKGVRSEFKSLKGELEILEPFLRDAEAKAERGEVSDAAKVWLKQLREEADRIEDVVDEYTYHVEEHRRQGGFIGSIRKAGHFIKALKPRHQIALEIRDIEESLRKIKKRGQSYGFRPFEQGGSSSTAATDKAAVDPRIGSLFIDDDELVGIDSMLKELVKSLVEGPSARTVISLVGEGGIGKTTLAKKVYDDVVAKGFFECHVWITVSQSYNINKVLEIMKSQICQAAEQPRGEVCTIEGTIDLLRNSLQGKRYVVVFDDVWQTDFWGVIKHALPSNDKGSKIILTTRNAKVVESFKATSCDVVQELKTWSAEQAWELFCKRAFCFEFDRSCPPDLEQLSREIVNKCQGLPLAIVAVAGLLSKKEKSKVEWQKVLDNLNYQFEEDRELSSVSKILLLSYKDLPYHLKLCFLYFGIFPEDYSIIASRLCNLWIAEGFIKSSRDKTLEEIAEEYLNELINRNLVSFELYYGIDRWCKVHDLIREIILRRMNDLCSCQIFNKSESRFKGKGHRLSIYGTTDNVLDAIGDSTIRSVLLFNINKLTDDWVIGLFDSFKLLKVLDFSYAPLHALPKQVGSLFHLKYLNLSGTNVKMLPKSIGELRNLQMLRVAQTLVRELPIEINKLRNLRHLIASIVDDKEAEYGLDSHCGVRLHGGFGNLEELQTLESVEAYADSIGFAKELSRLRKLKCLIVSKVTTEMGKSLGEAIGKMSYLEELDLSSSNEDEVLDLKYISSPPVLLRCLRLHCRLQKWPSWISELHNLHALQLNFSRVIVEPLECLKGLSNLVYLRMHQAYDGATLHFEAGSFQKLKLLVLRKLEGLKEVKIDREALPVLEKLDFGPSPLMKQMPSDIQHLISLKSLEINDMPREFVIALQPNIGGSDYWKIQHIPSVTFCYKTKGWTYYSYKLGSSKLLQRLKVQAS